MPGASLIKKMSYKGVTIFVYKTADGRGQYFMLPAGRSSHKYKTLTAAKKAIDRDTRRSKSRR